MSDCKDDYLEALADLVIHAKIPGWKRECTPSLDFKPSGTQKQDAELLARELYKRYKSLDALSKCVSDDQIVAVLLSAGVPQHQIITSSI